MILAYMGIKRNDAVDKATKEAIDMPGRTNLILSYRDYFPAIRWARVGYK